MHMEIESSLRSTRNFENYDRTNFKIKKLKINEMLYLTPEVKIM